MPYRGFNLNGAATAQDVIDAHLNGARLLRYQILPGLHIPPEHWNAHISSVIQHLDTVVFPNVGPAKVILDCHSAPGGMSGRTLKIFKDARCRQAFVEGWIRLANHVKNYPPVLGYGVVNEPAGTARQIKTLHLELHAVLKNIHPTAIICVTCAHSKPTEFSDTVYIPGAWHEAHVYTPMNLTHAGIMGYKPGKKYPGSFDKNDLIRAMRPMLKFQQKYQAQIFIGEFGICHHTDVESRANYMRDCMDLFSGWGWHFALHCWREGPGSIWSYEGQPAIMQHIHSSLGNQ